MFSRTGFLSGIFHNTNVCCRLAMLFEWGTSSVYRAFALHARGTGFDPRVPNLFRFLKDHSSEISGISSWSKIE